MSKSAKILIAVAIIAATALVIIKYPRQALAPEPKKSTRMLPMVPNTTTIFLAGDIMLSRNVDDRMEKAADFTLAFREVSKEVSSADISFANLESPFSDRGKHYIPNSLIFNADPRSIEGLKLAGFDVLSTANNHSFDQGTYGISYTYDWLKSRGIIPSGTGVPKYDPTGAVIEKNKINFGFLSYSFTAHNNGSNDSSPMIGNSNDLEGLKQDIWRLKGHFSDVVIVSMHAGTEYTRQPTQKQIDFAHAAIDAGADLVVGAHPHWVQTVEQYKGKWIFYSLGNFVFDQMWSQDTKEGLTVKIFWGDNGPQRIELNPVIIENYCCVRWATEDEKRQILGKLGLTSGILLDNN